jgi:hypothetical protein
MGTITGGPLKEADRAHRRCRFEFSERWRAPSGVLKRVDDAGVARNADLLALAPVSLF